MSKMQCEQALPRGFRLAVRFIVLVTVFGKSLLPYASLGGAFARSTPRLRWVRGYLTFVRDAVDGVQRVLTTIPERVSRLLFK
jgi:hypothetical protein